MLKNCLSDESKIDTLLSRSEIPIIDLAHSGFDERPSRSVVNRVAAQLQKALQEKGIAFMVNHGICDNKLQTAWSYLDSFCMLPPETQELYIRKGPNNHGYIKPGQEKFDGITPELRHAFNVCTLNVQNLPEEPLPGFREHIAELAIEFKALSSLILQALAIALNLPVSFFLQNHSHMMSDESENETTLRLLYYPPIIEDDNKCEMTKGRCQYSQQKCNMDCPRMSIDDSLAACDDEGDKSVTRCGAHCDYGTFTLLAQDSEGGLEVRLPGAEKWKRVGHLPGAILINAGEILSIWTDKKYSAIEHRVVIPEQQSIRARGRHSIAFFCHPDNCTIVAPLDLPDAQPETEKVKRKSSIRIKERVFTAYQLLQRKFKKTYNS